MYPALKEWAPQLKVFYNKQHYPGSWEGKDIHGTGRDLLKIGHEDLPYAVREWYVYCLCLFIMGCFDYKTWKDIRMYVAILIVIIRLKKNPKQRHFSLHDDATIFFAPGAMYPILPLFVDEPASSSASELAECEGVFEDLENYSTEAKDGVVLSKVTHKSTGKNEVEITIDAFQIKRKAGSEESNGKDEL